MIRMRLALAALATAALVAVAAPAGASERAPILTSAPKAVLGTHVTLTGLFFQEHKKASVYLESGKTRRLLATKMVATGGQFTLRLRLPKSAPKHSHLLACQNACTWRVRLTIAS
jgi:hypothetical protein